MTEKPERRSRNPLLDRRSYLQAASGVAGLAAFSSAASASESTAADTNADDADASELPQVEAFDEPFDDLSAFSGDVSAFEIVTSAGEEA